MVSKAWQERHERVRAALRGHALALFSARGYDDVSVADVAEAAGVTERTVFRYFASKDALVLDIAGEETWDPLFRLLESHAFPGGALAQISAAFAELAPADDEVEVLRMRLLSETPTLRMVWRESFHTFEVRLARWLEQSPESRMTGADARLVARLVVTAHEHAVKEWLAGPSEDRTIDGFVALESHALDVLARGVEERLGDAATASSGGTPRRPSGTRRIRER